MRKIWKTKPMVCPLSDDVPDEFCGCCSKGDDINITIRQMTEMFDFIDKETDIDKGVKALEREIGDAGEVVEAVSVESATAVTVEATVEARSAETAPGAGPPVEAPDVPPGTLEGPEVRQASPNIAAENMARDLGEDEIRVVSEKKKPKKQPMMGMEMLEIRKNVIKNYQQCKK
jgi:hypothetical protein